MNNALHVK